MPQQASPPSSLQASSVVETDVAPTSPTVQYASLRDQLVNSQSPGANRELEDFMRREIS
jgi:translation elongation factor EF-1beta